MSELTTTRGDITAALVPTLRDFAITLAWFVVAALIGALIWWQVTPLPEYTRTADGASMSEFELGQRVAADGWFFVIAVVGGLLSGIALVSWRRRDPVLMVVLVAAAGVLATWIMLQTGRALGPSDTEAALRVAKTGAEVPLQLKIAAHGLWVVWSVAALIGAVGVIWGSDHQEKPSDVPGLS